MEENSENCEDEVVSTPADSPTPSDATTVRAESPQPSSSREDGYTTPPRQQGSRPSPNTRSSTRRTRQRVAGAARSSERQSHSAAPQHMGAAAVRDESFCECPQQSQTRDLTCQCGEEDTAFEWVWDRDSKSIASYLSDDGREVRFHINYSSGTAAVRGYTPMTDRQHFWEIKMTTPVYGTDIMVGVGTGTVDLNSSRYNFCSFLGKDAESWGFSYFGRTQHKGDFTFVEHGRFGQGSIIGVHLDMWHGALSFYKNRRPLGRAYRGLSSKTLYPMVSSTAARTGMRLIKSCSFSTSLQFLCCQVLRKLIPAHLDVTEALKLPPGLHAFLTNNLSWLLRPCELESSSRPRSSGSKTSPRKNRKRRKPPPPPPTESDDDDSDDGSYVARSKRVRRSSSESGMSDTGHLYAGDSHDEDRLAGTGNS